MYLSSSEQSEISKLINEKYEKENKKIEVDEKLLIDFYVYHQYLDMIPKELYPYIFMNRYGISFSSIPNDSYYLGMGNVFPVPNEKYEDTVYKNNAFLKPYRDDKDKKMGEEVIRQLNAFFAYKNKVDFYVGSIYSDTKKGIYEQLPNEYHYIVDSVLEKRKKKAKAPDYIQDELDSLMKEI